MGLKTGWHDQSNQSYCRYNLIWPHFICCQWPAPPALNDGLPVCACVWADMCITVCDCRALEFGVFHEEVKMCVWLIGFGACCGVYFVARERSLDIFNWSQYSGSSPGCGSFQEGVWQDGVERSSGLFPQWVCNDLKVLFIQYDIRTNGWLYCTTVGFEYFTFFLLQHKGDVKVKSNAKVFSCKLSDWQVALVAVSGHCLFYLWNFFLFVFCFIPPLTVGGI